LRPNQLKYTQTQARAVVLLWTRDRPVPDKT